MKGIMTVLLLCLGTQAYAISICQTLKISIKNDTPSNCFLIQKVIKSGTITKRQPYKIKSGATTMQFEVDETKRQAISVLLTYECGDDKTITLLSSKEACGFNNRGKVQGVLVKSSNLSAVSSISDTSYYSSKPSNILWTIS